jgi:hypothetical protein
VKRFTRWLIAIPLCGGCLGGSRASGAVQVFINDYAGFQAAAGPLSMIDFETLPDGSPSVAGTPITSAFNYDLRGAHFSSPISEPFITGNAQFGFNLTALAPSLQLTWIDVGLAAPVRAFGVFFPSRTRLYIFNADQQLIAWTQYAQTGASGLFLGLISDAPIYAAMINRGSDGEVIHSVVFEPIPEPGSACMFAFMGAVLTRRRVARSRA